MSSKIMFAKIPSPKILPLIALGALAYAPASHADSKEFRDWFAVCDNVRTCSAYGVAPDIGGAYFRFERDGAPDATLKIVIGVDLGDGVTAKLAFDDASLPGLPADPVVGKKGDDDDIARIEFSEPRVVETLVASLRKAAKLKITRIDPPNAKDKSDPAETEVSLAGAAAAMLWMDEQQKRIGTVTALVGRGDKSASAVPAPPALPIVIAAKRPTTPAPKKAPADVIAKARAVCEEKVDMEDATRLSANDVMYWFHCKEQSGAYNYMYALILGSPGKPPKEVEFSAPRGLVNVEANINPGFDQETGVLSFFNKGRGIGDCGQASDWVWDGRAFRLLSYRSMGDCKGVPLTDWPVFYRAERK
jgi:hypothetical protein